MSRTARTIAQTRKGKEVVIADRFVPVYEQLEALRKFKVMRSHAEYESVTFQESDGEELLIRFLTPAAEKQLAEARANEHKQHLAAVEADKADAKAEQEKAGKA